MSNNNRATIGTVSHGSLRNADLLWAFAKELERLSPGPVPPIVGEALTLAEHRSAAFDDSWPGEDLSTEVSDVVLDLAENYLSELAPPYCYFGAHPGDASDFGFWPMFEAAFELPRVSDPNEVEAMGEDCVFVNDHGNVTVYAADGSVIWDCV